MRQGIIASQPLALPVGEVVLSGTFDFNFRTGDYLVSEVAVSLSDYIDHPADVIDGMGLYGGSSASYTIETLLGLSDKLISGSFGLIIDWVRLGTVCEPIYVSNVGDDPKFHITDSKALGILASDSEGATSRDLEEGSPSGLGEDGVRHVMALNRTNDLIEMSLDGGAVISDATSLDSSGVTDAWLSGVGANSTGRIIFRRLIVGDLFDTSDLPALSANSGAPVALANDNFAGRISLTLDVPLLSCNLSATAEASEPAHAGITATRSMWFEFTAPSDANYTVTASGDIDPNDPALAVYTGTAVGSLTEVAAAESPPYNTVTFAATSGISYAIAVDLAFLISGFTVVVEAAGATPLSPAHADLSLSTTAPTVARTANVSLSPSSGSLVLSATAPSRDVTGSVSLSPAGTNLLLSTTAPTVDVSTSGHRYWRILVSHTSTDNSTNIAEIELRSTSGGADQTGSGTPAVSGSLAGSAADAFDNNSGTTWHSALVGSLPSTPAWISYDFGSGVTKSIVEVVIQAHPSNPAYSPIDFAIEWSDNNSSWTQEWAVTGSTGWSAGETRTFTKP